MYKRLKKLEPKKNKDRLSEVNLDLKVNNSKKKTFSANMKIELGYLIMFNNLQTQSRS